MGNNSAGNGDSEATSLETIVGELNAQVEAIRKKDTLQQLTGELAHIEKSLSLISEWNNNRNQSDLIGTAKRLSSTQEEQILQIAHRIPEYLQMDFEGILFAIRSLIENPPPHASAFLQREERRLKNLLVTAKLDPMSASAFTTKIVNIYRSLGGNGSSSFAAIFDQRDENPHNPPSTLR